MGLGGYLCWSAAAHEIYSLHGKKIIAYEKHPHAVKIVENSIFDNNSVFFSEKNSTDNSFNSEFDLKTIGTIINDVKWMNEQKFKDLIEERNLFSLMLNRPETNYCKLDTPTHATHRTDKHIIQQILEFYGIERDMKELRPRLYLTDEELAQVDEFCKELPEEFITIEPHSNTEYTLNREYPFEFWQWNVDRLICDFGAKFVQVGTGSRPLSGVIDLRNKTTFRTCAGVIGRSKLFMSTEGGLVHAATAMQTPTICVTTGYQHERMVAYPQNENIWLGHDGAPCGIKRPRCEKCWNAVKNSQPGEIITGALKLLKLQ
jgi:hypothetical protein